MNAISILLVDDTRETLEVMAQCLRALGHQVTTANGGREATEIMEDRVFDLVITDLLMPDTDGVQVITAARRWQPTARIIAMTGGGEFLTARCLLKLAGTLGADEQLTKPFTRAQLIGAIERACGVEPVLVGAA